MTKTTSNQVSSTWTVQKLNVQSFFFHPSNIFKFIPNATLRNTKVYHKYRSWILSSKLSFPPFKLSLVSLGTMGL